jgi:hypothetical protein
MLRIVGLTVAVAGLVVGVSSNTTAGGITVMDQIGPNATDLQGLVAYTSQIFEPIYNVNNLAMSDNFSITGATLQLDEVDLVTKGYSGFTSYANVTGWQVAIYSSPTAAVNAGPSLTGDIYNYVAAPSTVTITTPYTSVSTSALVQIPISETLGPGTYYIGVMAVMLVEDGTIGVYSSNYPGTPSDSNAVQVNPSGKYFPSGMTDTGVNAAYRIIAAQSVPEPSSLSLALLGCGLVSVWAGRGRLKQS